MATNLVRVKETSQSVDASDEQSGPETLGEITEKRDHRVSTGPKTQRGKDRSKVNATRHGIFAKVAVLPNESQQEFAALWKGLRSSLQPIGTLEETLVEKLAVLWWRYRRCLAAEAAEIRADTEFIEWDRDEHMQTTADMAPGFAVNGLTKLVANREVLRRCLDALNHLRDKIQIRGGLNLDHDAPTLKRLFGRSGDLDNSHPVVKQYLRWAIFSAAAKEQQDEKRKEERNMYAKGCELEVLDEIENEITRLRSYDRKNKVIQAQRLRLQSIQRGVPKTEQLDRLQRYETSICRDIERTLEQFHRIQRMRLGQAMPPEIKVSLAGVQHQ